MVGLDSPLCSVLADNLDFVFEEEVSLGVDESEGVGNEEESHQKSFSFPVSFLFSLSSRLRGVAVRNLCMYL